MRRRAVVLATFAGTLAFAAPAAVDAQGIYFGVGGLFGVGDFGDATDPGVMGIAGLSFELGESGASLGVEGTYGMASGAEDDLGATFPDIDVYSAMGWLLYGFGGGQMVSPYVFGGAGILGFDVDLSGADEVIDASETQFGYQAGVGLDIPFTDRVGLFAEGRYMGSSDVDLIAAILGLGIGFGG